MFTRSTDGYESECLPRAFSNNSCEYNEYIIWYENIKKHEDLYASEGDDFY